MPIDVALLGCAHPHVPDVLGVLASEPDLRLVAVWDADPSAIPAAISGAAVARAETAIRRANAAVICAPTDQRPALCVQAARAGLPDARREAGRADRGGRPRRRARGRPQPDPGDGGAVPARAARARPARGRAARAAGRAPRGRDGGARAPGRGRRLVRRPARVDARPGPRRRRRLRRPRAACRRRARGAPGRRAARAPHRRARPAGDGERRRRRHRARHLGGRAAHGPHELGGAARRARGRRRRGPPARRPCTRACSCSTAARGEPERWVGPPPDAGEAVRAFANRLRARRFPRDGLAPAVQAQALLEAAIRVA